MSYLKPVLGTLYLLAIATRTASADPLSFDEILAELDGHWAIPIENETSKNIIYDCAQHRNELALDSEDGILKLRSTVVKDGVVTSETRATIRHDEGRRGRLQKYLLIEYDYGEAVPPVWHLAMPNSDTFTWRRSDWRKRSWLTVRRRCS